MVLKKIFFFRLHNFTNQNICISSYFLSGKGETAAYLAMKKYKCTTLGVGILQINIEEKYREEQ